MTEKLTDEQLKTLATPSRVMWRIFPGDFALAASELLERRKEDDGWRMVPADEAWVALKECLAAADKVISQFLDDFQPSPESHSSIWVRLMAYDKLKKSLHQPKLDTSST
jgi:hypothetical protein